ncbi:MAG TPA: hypothetical protein VJR58_13235 [Vineibacter sp.]|nr:hypothetical protein [Vineibacter sp.]
MEERYDFLTPRLRLFLSLDIQGSTSFKYQVTPETFEAWLPIIHWFYIETQAALERSWLRAAGRFRHADAGPDPILWKSAGDELLFVKEVTHPLQCLAAVLAFRDVLALQDVDLQRRSNGRLRLKATAWLAGFPNVNKEIPLVGSYAPDSEPHGNDTMVRIARFGHDTLAHQRDFVGPSIDLGFRLTELATPRRFVVSVELAYLLADMMIRHQLTERLNLQVEEGQVLRGILNDQEYPLIWIDMLAHTAARNSLERLMSRPTCDVDVLREVCTQFIRAAPILVMPYIVVDGTCIYGTVPPQHVDALATLRRRISQELSKEEQFVHDQASEEGPGSLDAELSKNLEEQAAKVRGSLKRDDKDA